MHELLSRSATQIAHAIRDREVSSEEITRAALDRINDVLAVAPLAAVESAASDSGDEPDIISLCKAMDDARGAKDWSTSDSIRAQLENAGYDVQTTPEGTVAEKKLA